MPLSATPSQSLSASSQTSGLPGKLSGSSSSQSGSAAQMVTPSLSSSGASSVRGSQSLSRLSQVVSVAFPGLAAVVLSLQSSSLSTQRSLPPDEGFLQSVTGAAEPLP